MRSVDLAKTVAGYMDEQETLRRYSAAQRLLDGLATFG